MPAPAAFEYAVVRIVPRVEREEFVNAGVLLFCEARDLLLARLALDPARLRALSPDVDLDLVARHLDVLARVCEGGPDAGPIGAMPARERWRWLVSPRSTILQTSAPHAGVTDAPEQALERLARRLVLRDGSSGCE